MPGKTVAPGFFGKVPRSGDFVLRRLSKEFVTVWDAFVTQNVVPLMGDVIAWPENGLRFLLGDVVIGLEPHVGIVVPSHDQVGRQFPLTVASPLKIVASPTKIAAWFAEITGPTLDAAEGLIDVGELDLALEGIASPQLSVQPSVQFQLIVPGLAPVVADFHNSSQVLRELLSAKAGVA